MLRVDSLLKVVYSLGRLEINIVDKLALPFGNVFGILRVAIANPVCRHNFVLLELDLLSLGAYVLSESSQGLQFGRLERRVDGGPRCHILRHSLLSGELGLRRNFSFLRFAASLLRARRCLSLRFIDFGLQISRLPYALDGVRLALMVVFRRCLQSRN